MIKKVLLLAVMLAMATAFYEGSSPVVSLNSDNYEQVNTGIWFVEYFASWCGHCRNMAPEWEKAAGALKGIVQVAAIDAGTHKVNVQGIQGFPTIRFLVNGQEKDYKGGRSAKDFVSFALDEVRKVHYWTNSDCI